jgi:osmotically inducible protein OsmC
VINKENEMPLRKGKAVWKGSLKDGEGAVSLGSGAFEGKVSFASRFENGKGTNPEELIGAAHAACFSMALSHMLGEKGYKPDQINTSAGVKIEKKDGGFRISSVELDTQARIRGIKEEEFIQYAEKAKNECPVSQVLKGAEISLKAKLEDRHQ